MKEKDLRKVIDGQVCKACLGCGEWKPEAIGYFRLRRERGTFHLSCLTCEALYKRLQASAPRLMQTLTSGWGYGRG